jgi:hypothetical protein
VLHPIAMSRSSDSGTSESRFECTNHNDVNVTVIRWRFKPAPLGMSEGDAARVTTADGKPDVEDRPLNLPVACLVSAKQDSIFVCPTFRGS